MQCEHLVIGRLEVVIPLIGLRLAQYLGFHQRLRDGREFSVVFNLFSHELEYFVEQHAITRQVGR